MKHKVTKQGVRDLNTPKNYRRDQRSKYERCMNHHMHEWCTRSTKCELCGFYDNWPDYDYSRDRLK